MLLTVAVVAVQSFALSIPVSTTTYQAQYGLSYAVASSFTALDHGFATLPTSQLASAQPCVWVTGTTCRTAETQNHLQYSFDLTLNTPPALLTSYTVTVQWSQNGGPQTLMGQLTVSVTAAALAGQQMTFEFDTGSSSFTSPLSIDVTVA